MTALDAIRYVDEKQHNGFCLEDKLLWLSQVELMNNALLARCGLEPGSAQVEPETRLSIPRPYDLLYLRYLEAQIDYANQEYLKYNNAMALFQAVWQEYANSVRRSAETVSRRNFF